MESGVNHFILATLWIFHPTAFWPPWFLPNVLENLLCITSSFSLLAFGILSSSLSFNSSFITCLGVDSLNLSYLRIFLKYVFNSFFKHRMFGSLILKYIYIYIYISTLSHFSFWHFHNPYVGTFDGIPQVSQDLFIFLNDPQMENHN